MLLFLYWEHYLVTVYNPNGMHQPSWSTGDGHRQDDEWEFSNLLSPLQPLKEKTIVVEGVSRWGNEDGARHQQGMVGLLTGRELGDEGFSIDQLLADHWNTQSLLLGVQNIPGLYNTSTGYSNFRVSFRGRREAGAQVANNNPFSVFQQTFAGLTPTNPYENFATNRSVLDGLLDEVNSVKRRLSADDIHLLDAHQQGIRDIELLNLIILMIG